MLDREKVLFNIMIYLLNIKNEINFGEKLIALSLKQAEEFRTQIISHIFNIVSDTYKNLLICIIKHDNILNSHEPTIQWTHREQDACVYSCSISSHFTTLYQRGEWNYYEFYVYLYLTLKKK